MKKVNIMEAQHNLSKVLRQVEEGQTVYITRRKQVVAKIVPAKEEGPINFPDFAKRSAETIGGHWEGMSSEELIDETRGDH